jgi:hypothetical protein
LPPTPAEAEAFLRRQPADAYEKLIDRLLDSPHYGERWGRHWLDVAGYADSDGYSDADPPRAYAYKYRDYVIGSFNSDKPFDQFITEQLAGDELARATRDNTQPRWPRRTRASCSSPPAFSAWAPTAPPRPASLTTTPCAIRLWPTRSRSFPRRCSDCPSAARNATIIVTIRFRRRITTACAPCSNLPTIRRTGARPDQRLVSLYTEADRKKRRRSGSRSEETGDEKDAKQKQYIDEALTKHLEKFEADLRGKLRAAYDTPADKRTAEQKKLLATIPA